MSDEAPRRLGEYFVFEEIAAGGMATVHFGRRFAHGTDSPIVALKRLHPNFARDVELRAMLVDEARVSLRVAHRNVVSTLDVVEANGELALVMEYVHGESLSNLLMEARRRGERVPADIAIGILVQVLAGLHAAHSAKTDANESLGLVHRDVSPQNVIVGLDGVARLADFGVAKAVGRLQTTRDGRVKGKCAYMAPEQLRGARVDARTDVYAAGVVLWETLTGQRLFEASEPEVVLLQVLERRIAPPSQLVPDIQPALDTIVLRALSRDPSRRFASAQEMAEALEGVETPASAVRLAAWVEGLAGPALALRKRRIAAIEQLSVQGMAPRPLVTRRRRLGAIAALALVAASGLAFAASRSARTSVPREPASPASSLSVLAVAASASPTVASSATVAPPELTAPSPTTASPTRPLSSHERRPPQRPRTRPVGVSAPSCNPPFRVLQDGIRIMKPECM